MTSQDSYSHGLRIESCARLVEVIENTVSGLKIAFCDVSGFGLLEWAVLSIESSEKERRLEGPFQLIDLKGRCRQAGDVTISDFVCTIARNTDNGIEVLGGRLEDAEARFVELTLTPLNHSENEAEIVPAPRPVVKAKQPSKPDSKTVAPKFELRDETTLDARWARAVAESNRVQEAASSMLDGEAEVRPKRGDIVHHRQFGECTVMRIDDDHVTLRKPDRRSVQLGLSILKFVRTGSDGRHEVFQVEVKPR